MPEDNEYIPQKVAMLGSLPPLRALSSYCLSLSLALAEHCNMAFISFKKIYPAFLYPGGDLKEDDTFPSIDNPRLNVRRRLTWYNPLTWMTEGLLAQGELLHAQWWTSFLGPVYFVVLIGFKLRRKPVVITVHNVLSHEKISFHKMVSGILFKLCDHFIVHSASNETQLQKYFNIPADRISNIPHGPLEFQIQGSINRETARQQFGFRTSDKVLLLFGAIRPYKGTDTALKAFAKVVKKVPDARLLIAGKLWEPWERYDAMIKDLDVAEYVKMHLNYIAADEVGRFFVAADLVVLPYHHFDAQSGVGATALAFGKPMIVCDTGGLPDFVGDPFYVVPPKDAATLAEKIIVCLNDPSRLAKMSEDSKMIADRISWKAIAEKTLSVYKDIILKKKRARK